MNLESQVETKMASANPTHKSHKDLEAPKRKRYYSWSRRYRGKKINPDKEKDKLRNEVQGESYLFMMDNDNSCFRGNIICDQMRVFKFVGFKQEEEHVADEEGVEDIDKLASELSKIDTKIVVNKDSLNSSDISDETEDLAYLSGSLSSEEESDPDNMLDPYLLEKLLLGTSSPGEEGTPYKVHVTDMESGLVYTLDNVLVHYGQMDDLYAQCDQFLFKSDQVFKGAQADIVLNEIFGSAFVDKSLQLFKGKVRFVYYDQILKPMV